MLIASFFALMRKMKQSGFWGISGTSEKNPSFATGNYTIFKKMLRR
jgi:hypothetical protein